MRRAANERKPERPQRLGALVGHGQIRGDRPHLDGRDACERSVARLRDLLGEVRRLVRLVRVTSTSCPVRMSSGLTFRLQRLFLLRSAHYLRYEIREIEVVCQRRSPQREPSMSMLLLVRGADDVRSAVEAASKFLVYQRQRFAESREADEVLGVWLRRELDAHLPAWPWFDRELGAGRSIDVPGASSKVSPGESGVGIRESFSLSGLWALCWIDGTLLSTAHSATERRRTILDSLLGATSASRSSATETFFPVFAAADAVESIEATMREFKDRYPQIVGGTWFVDDRERGIVPAQEADG